MRDERKWPEGMHGDAATPRMTVDACQDRSNHATDVVMACSQTPLLTSQACRRCECQRYIVHPKGCRRDV